MSSRNPYIFVEGGADKDWRAFENGEPQVAVGTGLLPEGCDYAEGLHTYAISPQTWVKTLTVARGGEGHASQHIIAQRSLDGGVSWSPWFDVEPEGPPPSSYGSFFRHPLTGQVYYMYTLGPESDPVRADGSPFRGHRHHVGRIAYRYVSPRGDFSERYFLNLPQAAIDRTNVFLGKHTLHYGHPLPEVVIGEDGYGWYSKIGPEPLVSNTQAFVVKFCGFARNDRLEQLSLELLPSPERGLQGAESVCICEFQPILMDAGGWYFKYRSTSGYAGLAVSHDLGKTWQVGNMLYNPGGLPVKNSESPLAITRDGQGRIFLVYYNDSYTVGEGSYAARDRLFISHVKIENQQVYVSQPELIYYHTDQSGYERHSTRRLNPPIFNLELDGSLSGQGSDKLQILRFTIPDAFLDALAGQWQARGIPAEGLVLDLVRPAGQIPAPVLPAPNTGGGFAISLALQLDESGPGQIVLNGMWDRGVRLLTGRKDNLLFVMSDGQRTVRVHSDVGSLVPGTPHQVTVIVDGHPAMVSLVIDGRLQDGGLEYERGTVWFSHEFEGLDRVETWKVAPDLKGRLERLVVHERCLLTSEAIALQRVLKQEQAGE
jgi:hypothetical protein